MMNSAMTVFFYCFREREQLLNINEMLAALKKLGPSPLKSTNPTKNAEMRI